MDQEFDNYVYGKGPFEDNFDLEAEQAGPDDLVDVRDKDVVINVGTDGSFFRRLFEHPGTLTHTLRGRPNVQPWLTPGFEGQQGTVPSLPRA